MATLNPTTRSTAAGVSTTPTATCGVAVAVLVAFVLVACGAPDRPSLEMWRGTWQTALEAVPDQQTLADPPERDRCRHVLGELRRIRPELVPAPDPIVDTAADAWIAYAEHVFFLCFEGGPANEAVASAYDTLGRLRAEVETALRTAAEARGQDGF